MRKPNLARPRLPYMPGLDGLRGIAVLAVLAYHAQLPWSDGGFLGVEVFFVLSGYLITALLLQESAHRGRPHLGRFWLRRARRLLPALWLLLATLPVVTAWLAPDALPRLREDTLAALAYITNWVYIFRDIPYFEHYGRPPLLQHLWSLAIEEQFYLLWPLLFMAAYRPRANPHARRRLLGWILGLAAASTALRWALYVPYDDATRVYYGTDTRASGILLGAALAIVWPPRRVREDALRERARGWAEALGWVGLVTLPVLFARLNDYTPTLYRGGFLLTDAATLAVLVGVSHPDTWVGRALGWRPLRWMGQRSYGLYLWHWPVFILSRPGMDWDVAPGLALGIQLVVTFVLTEVSYRAIEHPIRRDGVRAWWRRVRARGPYHATAAGLTALVLLAWDVAILAPNPVQPTPYAAAPPPGLPEAARLPTPAATAPPATPTATPRPVTPQAIAAASTPTARPSQAMPTPTPQGPRVTVIGDSVMQASVTFDMWAPWHDQVVVDVKEGRKMQDLAELVPRLAQEGRLGPVVVVHLGTNRPFPPEALDAAMRALLEHGVQRVYFLNIRRPVRWEDFVNQTLAESVARWPQAQLLDWHSLAQEHPEWFVDDGTHLRYYGAQAYVQFIMEAIAAGD